MSSDTWTLGRLLDWTTNFLKEKKAETPRLDAEVLLAHVAGCQRIALYTRFDEPAAEEVRARYRQLVKERVQGCPVAYLVGYKEFYNLRFAVSPAVLIPRPETEILVLEAIRLMKPLTAPKIADVGTGSGAIAITLGKHLPQARIAAIDVSEEALKIAQKNAQTHRVLERINFVQGDLFTSLPAEARFDLIASNPPYIATQDWDTLPATVAKFEPRLALEGGPGGLQVITQLIEQSKARLVPQGYLLLEIGADQGQSVPDLITQTGGYAKITVLPDHAGLPRVVRAQSAN